MAEKNNLKTLKNLDVGWLEENTVICKEDLKDIAKEWIKKLDYNHYDELPKDFFNNTNPDHYYDMTQWIKHFFNLEED